MTEFWNWYFNVLTNEDDKVKIAAWALTLTALTFFLNFIVKPIKTLIKKESPKEQNIEHQGGKGISITSTNQTGGQTAHTIINQNTKTQ